MQLAYQAVARHRRDTAKHYGLDSTIPSEPWSSRPVLLEALQWHFDSTDSLLRELVRDFGAHADGADGSRHGLGDVSSPQALQGELRAQMAGLAEFAFSASEERLQYLETCVLLAQCGTHRLIWS